MEVDGAQLLAEARRAVLAHLSGEPGEPPGTFRERYGFKSGVFVTITRGDSLRGCIGYVEPDAVLCDTIRDAAVAAATGDPRFPPVTLGELPHVAFEVTILEPPEPIPADSPEEYPSSIVPGRDGIMVRRGRSSGLLLPQVATQYGWSAGDLLQNTCLKAGLPADSWRDPNTEVWRFRGTIFRE